MLFLGCLAFALFFLGDINDCKLHQKLLTFSFPAGALLLCVALAFQLDTAGAPVSGLFERILLFIALAVFAALLIYSLFFAFPVSSAYAAPGEKRPACTDGVYALCRHPGVLWLFFVMLCLSLVGGLPFSALFIYTALNLLLVLFEDRYAFPLLITGYAEYRRDTPFLIPTRDSITKCLRGKNTD
ncbi:MAG: hypothetical protein RR055_01100 [Oscillospiraceae bacterium]